MKILALASDAASGLRRPAAPVLLCHGIAQQLATRVGADARDDEERFRESAVSIRSRSADRVRPPVATASGRRLGQQTAQAVALSAERPTVRAALLASSMDDRANAGSSFRGKVGLRPITYGAVDAGEATSLASGESQDRAPPRREPCSSPDALQLQSRTGGANGRDAAALAGRSERHSWRRRALRHGKGELSSQAVRIACCMQGVTYCGGKYGSGRLETTDGSDGTAVYVSDDRFPA